MALNMIVGWRCFYTSCLVLKDLRRTKTNLGIKLVQM